MDGEAVALLGARRAGRRGDERDALPGGDEALSQLPGDAARAARFVGGEQIAEDDDVQRRRHGL